jgi:hypothetical protein
VAALERLAHERGVSHALEGVVRAAVGEIDQVGDEVSTHFFGVDEVGHAELARDLFARGVDVDADDHVRADHLRRLNHVEADAAEAEDDHVGARFDLRGPQHCAHARGDAAADVADLVEGSVLADLRERDLGQDRVVRERRAAHVVMDLSGIVTSGNTESALAPSGEPCATMGAAVIAPPRLRSSSGNVCPALLTVSFFARGSIMHTHAVIMSFCFPAP